MNSEQQSVLQTRPNDKPPGQARSLAVRAKDGDLNALLERLRAVWFVLAEFGVYDAFEEYHGSIQDFDDEEWQPKLAGRLLPDAIETLPAPPEIWERDWAWWSSAMIEDVIKLDLVELAMPNSFGTIHQVIQQCGGDLLGHFIWQDSRSFLDDVRAYEQHPKEYFDDE